MLFRPEIVAENSNKHMGVIRLGKNPRFTTVAVISLLLGLSLVLFAVLGEVTRKVTVNGIVTPAKGVIKIATQTGGVVKNINVKEGQKIKKGDPLYAISNEIIGISGEMSKIIQVEIEKRERMLSSEKDARINLSTQQRTLLDSKITMLKSSVRAADRELEHSQKRVEFAKKNADRFRELYDSGYISESQSQQKMEELLDYQAKSDNALRVKVSLESELSSIESERRGINARLEGELSQIDRAVAALSQESIENSARGLNIILAPEDGVISNILVSSGVSVSSGQIVGSYVPTMNDTEEELEVHLFAASGEIGFVKTGQICWMKFASFPYQKFGMLEGEIISVGKTPLSSADLAFLYNARSFSKAGSDKATYRIMVKLNRKYIDAYGQRHELKPGMEVDSEIVQDKRAIWEWVFEPLIAAGVRMKVLGAKE